MELMTEARPVFEQASRCPKCDTPGEDRNTSPGPNGSTLHHVYCVNEKCVWYNTPCQLIQVNKDGSIPPPKDHTGEKKIYQGFEGHDQRAAELIETLKRNAQAELRPGGAEI